MGGTTLELSLIGLLILANGLFSMSEMAVVSARKARLRQRADDGSKGAAVALELAENPHDFLSTVQVGITLIGTLAGAFGGATVAEKVAVYLKQFPASGRLVAGLSVSAPIERRRDAWIPWVLQAAAEISARLGHCPPPVACIKAGQTLFQASSLG